MTPAPHAPPWPVRVTAVGQVAGGAVAWRYHGQVMLTAIAKATLSFVPGGAMAMGAPIELARADAHVEGNVRRSLIVASDMAPHRPRADVVLTGHALAGPGTTRLRLAVAGTHVLFDRTIQLVDRGGVPGASHVPLVYEEAAGDTRREDNPAGSPTSPRLVDPDDAARPACFAPLPQSWPLRHRLLAGLDRRMLDGLHLDVPPNFNWTFYQAAPPEQRTEYLRGDEWILLAGFHPTLPPIVTQLPSLKGLGEVYGLPGFVRRPVDMSLDTVHIDIDRRLCSVVFRGSVPIPDAVPLSALDLRVGVEVATASRASSPSERPAARVGSSTMDLGPCVAAGVGSTQTAVMRLEDLFRASTDGMKAPFALANPGSQHPPGPEIPGAPWAAARARRAPAVPDGLQTTFSLDSPLSPRAFPVRLAEAPATTAPAPAPPPGPAPVPARSEPHPLAAAPKPIEVPPATPAIPAMAPKAPSAPPPAPAPVRRESPAAEAVRGSVYGKFSPRRR